MQDFSDSIADTSSPSGIFTENWNNSVAADSVEGCWYKSVSYGHHWLRLKIAMLTAQCMHSNEAFLRHIYDALMLTNAELSPMRIKNTEWVL